MSEKMFFSADLILSLTWLTDSYLVKYHWVSLHTTFEPWLVKTIFSVRWPAQVTSKLDNTDNTIPFLSEWTDLTSLVAKWSRQKMGKFGT